MNHDLFKPVRLTLMASAVAITFVAPPVLAASACKGLEQAVCVAKEACHWTNGYTRKDGIKVSSHCRSSPKKKKASSTPPPKAATKESS